MSRFRSSPDDREGTPWRHRSPARQLVTSIPALMTGFLRDRRFGGGKRSADGIGGAAPGGTFECTIDPKRRGLDIAIDCVRQFLHCGVRLAAYALKLLFNLVELGLAHCLVEPRA